MSNPENFAERMVGRLHRVVVGKEKNNSNDEVSVVNDEHLYREAEIRDLEEGRGFPPEVIEKARALGMERVEVRSNAPAQLLIQRVVDGSIDIETDEGQKDFVEQWQKNCPEVPMPCVPEKNDFWYLRQLKNRRIVENLAPHFERVAMPDFGNEEVLLIDSWEEKDYNASEAKKSHRSALLKALLGKDSTIISREKIDEALWKGVPADRRPTEEHLRVLNQLGCDPNKFELRLIRQDEYARLADVMKLGQKRVWTHFAGYVLGDDGDRYGLHGGDRGYGGPSDVVGDWRDDADDDLAVRLVLSRKN